MKDFQETEEKQAEEQMLGVKCGLYLGSWGGANMSGKSLQLGGVEGRAGGEGRGPGSQFSRVCHRPRSDIGVWSRSGVTSVPLIEEATEV